jgi:hypothetical protein
MNPLPARATLLSFALVLLTGVGAGTASAAPIKPGGSYKGVTSQGKACDQSGSAPCTVSVKVSSNGTELQRFKIKWSADCGGDTLLNRSTVFNKFALPANGKLDISGPYEEPAFNGLTGEHKVNLQGKFKQSADGGYTVKGTFTDVIKVGSATSSEHYTCRTGKVSFSAST